jgi:glyoxylase-like metal-dependent hydrolase (beta-lactamase superfamily II)
MMSLSCRAWILRAAFIVAALGVVQHTETRAVAQTQPADVQSMLVSGFDSTKVYMLAGAGGNIAVQVGDDGVLLVDTGLAQSSDKVLAAIRKLTNKPIRYIINTHPHADHVGGNEAVLKAIGGQRTSQGGGGGGVENPDGALLISHQNTANRMGDAVGGRPPYPDAVIPKDTFLTSNKQVYFNNEPIDIWWHEAAHTDGDVVVHFRRSDVIVAGDLLTTNIYPIISLDEGGGINGLLDGLNHIIEVTVPRFNQIDGTRVIPGHGYLCNQTDVADIRDMATIIRDRIQHMISTKKMTLEQVKAAKPTLDFDGLYGATSGFWTTDKFIEAVYNDLKKPRKGPLPQSGLNFTDGGN